MKLAESLIGTKLGHFGIREAIAICRLFQLSARCQCDRLNGMNSTPKKTAALRIIDANLNRAAEGLRVVEEFLRFDLDDRHLTQLCKDLRHKLADAMWDLPAEQLHAARDSAGDVGAEIETAGEYARPDCAAVVRASLKRVQQAIRCLEEYSKIVAPSAARSFESIRYEMYTLEKAITSMAFAQSLFDGRTLYVLTDGAESPEAFRRRVGELVAAGVHVLQLRDKTLDDRSLIERARMLRTLTRNTGTLFIMNDRPDLAVLAQADGVHVGQEELSIKDTRRIVGAEMTIGVSTHTIEQARQAVLDGANYIGVGPTFLSGTKSFDHFTGLDLLRQVAGEIKLPAFAIGGIGPNNVSDVLDCGITRVAVGQAVTASGDVAAAARELLSALTRRESKRDAPSAAL